MIITNKDGTFAFSPAIIRITRGTLVVWVNSTKAPHTATGSSFNSGTIKSGGSYSFKFTSAGTFPYHCNFHLYMTATVIVS
jgi:plastocyanin